MQLGREYHRRKKKENLLIGAECPPVSRDFITSDVSQTSASHYNTNTTKIMMHLLMSSVMNFDLSAEAGGCKHTFTLWAPPEVTRRSLVH